MEKIRQALDRARLEREGREWQVADAERAVERVADRPGMRAAIVEPTPGAKPSAVAAADGAPVEEFHRSFVADPVVLERHRILPPAPSGAAADAFRLLRTQTLQRMRERGWQTLGIVSARSRDGKTTLAANLAATIAADPRHAAVLVDLDLRRPGVARLFGHVPEVGIEDFLRGDASLDACLVQPAGFARLQLLPGRSALPAAAGLAAGSRCQLLIDQLRAYAAHRIVLCDLPPLLEADDAIRVAPLLDCVLFVVSEGQTAREDVTRGLELLRETPVVGTVLNRSIEAVRSEAYG